MILRGFAYATRDLLARRPPASLARASCRPSGPEAFVLSDGAFQAPVGRTASTKRETCIQINAQAGSSRE